MDDGSVDTAAKVATLGPLGLGVGVGWRTARVFAANVLTLTLDVTFPPSCLVCRASADRPDALCAACWRRLGFIERPFCERLGTPFGLDLGDGLLSPEAISAPPSYGRARAAVRFDDGPARIMVHRLKYGDRTELARPMGAWMARAGADILHGADLVVAVPLHRRRLWLRRFNQAAILAEAVSRASGIPHRPLLLQRVKATASQVGMTRPQRLTNLQGAFRVPDGLAPAVESRRIVLIDDVLTTGATLDAAARAMLRAGASSVDVLVFARVVTGH